MSYILAKNEKQVRAKLTEATDDVTCSRRGVLFRRGRLQPPVPLMTQRLRGKKSESLFFMDSLLHCGEMKRAAFRCNEANLKTTLVGSHLRLRHRACVLRQTRLPLAHQSDNPLKKKTNTAEHKHIFDKTLHKTMF